MANQAGMEAQGATGETEATAVVEAMVARAAAGLEAQFILRLPGSKGVV